MFFHEYVDGVLIVRRISVSSWDGENADIWQDCYGISSFMKVASHELIRSQTSALAPNPIMEVVSVKFEGARFRFVSMEKQIIRFQSHGEKWTTKIDHELLQQYSETIFHTIEKNS